MKKYMPLVFAIGMISSLYSLPVRADTSGAMPETPASIKQPPVAGAAQTDAMGMPKLVVEFQTAHAEIPPSFQQNMDLFAKYLKDNPASMARIDGYADHTGHGPANAALAQKRADVVKNYLVTAGVASSRITAAGYGEVSEKTRNNTEAGKQLNRSAVGTILLAAKS